MSHINYMDDANNTNTTATGAVPFTLTDVINVYIGSLIFYMGVLFTVTGVDGSNRYILRDGKGVWVSHVTFTLVNMDGTITKEAKYSTRALLKVVKLVGRPLATDEYIDATLKAAHARAKGVA